GIYQLDLSEGLFVFTPHQTGSLFFAVTKLGAGSVTPGQNITSTSVPFTFDPINDPIECHLQRTFVSPFTSSYICFAYSMWSDGRQNHWEGRPDFPIMANEYKNGMPSVFLISAPFDLDTTVAFPLSVWLHGGGGLARQSLAGSRAELDISPDLGILVAHDDKMYGYRGAQGPHPDEPTWHFGYRKNYDPFITTTDPFDTIVNYTQRRYLWVDKWLAKNFNVDTNRINIHGHSMGSSGALALAKCFPRHYASATIFNSSCLGPDSISNTIYIFGTRGDHFPTNLKNRNGNAVGFYDLWDLYTNCSPERDIPLIRHWHGKNDDGGMHWGPVLIQNFHICDSIGTGIQHYWSERPHGMDMAPAFNDHWIQGIPANQQTAHDNVDFPELNHKSNESFPAFFNHRLDQKNNDPGTGLIGINNGDGDNWGTWGGYHRWYILFDTTYAWQAVTWLEGNEIFPNDNSPETFLTADIAIRRPQDFNPATGQAILWKVEDLFTGQTLQSGTTTVKDDSLVVIPQVNVYRENVRRVRISIADMINAVENESFTDNSIKLFPNPTNDIVYLEADWEEITVFDINGIERIHFLNNASQPHFNVSGLSSGNYFIEIITKDADRKMGRFVKQ
ncbi:MAG TPA: T9SS type A sorting domain-containing protein, partial [Saprospiraceae bacterium]|nr:T9SS type A sorting domain-containing protein [Saprospiraceae bacterium]